MLGSVGFLRLSPVPSVASCLPPVGRELASMPPYGNHTARTVPAHTSPMHKYVCGRDAWRAGTGVFTWVPARGHTRRSLSIPKSFHQLVHLPTARSPPFPASPAAPGNCRLLALAGWHFPTDSQGHLLWLCCAPRRTRWHPLARCCGYRWHKTHKDTPAHQTA